MATKSSDHQGELFTREAAPAGRACEGGQALHLRVEGKGRAVSLGASSICLGSAGENDVVLRDPFVSRRHAVFRRQGGRLWLHDRDSRNGTWVNDVRVERCQVGPGARIVLGRTGLMVARSRLAGDNSGPAGGTGMVAGHHSMQRVLKQIARLGPRSLPVLVLGETGTGKELVARALHEASPRRLSNLEPLNCAAIPSELAESELFGHERGAFTGAASRRAGAFERASGGTLFLDEVGEMPLSLQPKLLRVLEDGLVQRVGAAGRLEVDVRVVAATHRDLDSEARLGKFRLDLYHRLAVGIITLPALRQRAEDIPALVAHFLGQLAGQGPALVLDPAALTLLRSHQWPGNVRQLQAALHRASAEAGPHLGVDDFYFLGEQAPAPAGGDREGEINFAGRPFEEVKREIYLAMVAHCGGNRTAAAQALGIPKSTFHDQLRAMEQEGEGRV